VALLNQNGQPNVPVNPGAGQRGNNPFQTSPQNPPGSLSSPFPGTTGGSPFGTGPQSTQNPFGPGTNTTSPPK
jgi:hypothetical protein